MAKKTHVKVRLVPEAKPDSPFFYYVKKPAGGEKAKIKLKAKKYNPATRKHEVFVEKTLDRIQRTGYSCDMTINDYLSDKLNLFTIESLPELDDKRVKLLVRRMLGDKSAPTTSQITKGMSKNIKDKVAQEAAKARMDLD